MEQLPLFNVNGAIGEGSYEQADFPDLNSLVSHLDYLGVERSLVWHVAAVDINPAYGNWKLMKELEKFPRKERFFPCWVITPACFFEKDTLTLLHRYLASGEVRALRIIPSVSRFPVRQLERLLMQLVSYKPAVFWDCCHGHDELAFRDFEYLAGRFPELSFVVTQKMWGGFSSVVDLLWRCPNTYVDTSWLHMNEAIELLVEEFGAQRILFGLGYKSHYGAAIAALVFACISESQKQQIAHENAENLLRIPPAKKIKCGSSDLWKVKPLWRKFCSGLGLDGVEVIDAHAHTPPFTRGWIQRQSDIRTGLKKMIVRMDRLGVSRLLVTPEMALFGDCLSGNREGQMIMQEFSDRFSGYLVFHPLYSDRLINHLDTFFKSKFFVGFKILPSYWEIPVSDRRYVPLWEYAQRFRRPVLIHTWDDVDLLKDIVPRYGDVSFLLGHSGGGTKGRQQAEELALSFPNVYLEFCGSFCTRRPVETSMSLVGTDRVLYGSDAAGHEMAWELGRYLSLPLPDDNLLPGLAANIKRILSRIQPV